MLLGTAAAIAIAAVGFSGSANAACYWNGYNWNCASPQVYYPPYAYQSYYGYSQPAATAVINSAASSAV